MSFATALLLALAIDMVVGWPSWLYQRIGHPVGWIGALISALDRRLNKDSQTFPVRRLMGVITALLIIALAATIGWALQNILPSGWGGLILGAVFAWPLLAMRAMYTHVAAVYPPLASGQIDAARLEVAKIVGRDPSELDMPGITRAALESLAENTSDGIVAPVFWGIIAGLPGLFAYKAINTLDSMIGYRTPRHAAFGWAAARIDDVVNLIPARLTALCFCAVCKHPLKALRVMWHDAGHHRSPNAGWPEAALAGALNIRLSGPRRYHGKTSDEPWVNAQAPDPKPACLRRGLRLYGRSMALMVVVIAAIAFI